MGFTASNLTKIYGTQYAVNNVSFEVNKGEVVGFLGPNGAGKSTTMKILTCYILPTYGEVSVCGYDIYTHSREVRERIGYLPENNPLYPEMYVKEYLSFIARLHGLKGSYRQKRIREMIEITGLGPEINKKLGQLSKGYKQRTGLAQAMLHDPEVLILDEPTSGLDPNQIVEVREVIREMGKEKTVILSTHIMQEVQAVCNRVMIINKGSIVADNTAENLLEQYAGSKRLKVQFKKPAEKASLLKINGIKSAEQDNLYWYLISDGKQDIREEVFRYAVNNDNSVLEMNETEQSLEEVFHQLTLEKKGSDNK